VSWLLVAGLLLAVGCVVAFILLPSVDDQLKGMLACVLVLLLLVLRVPVAVAMAASGVLGIYSIGGGLAASNSLATVPYNSTASFSFTVLPMFVFMGIMLYRSGITSELYSAAKLWLSRFPAGLSATTITAGAGLASVSGSTIGVTYTLGRIGIPEMLRAGYDKRIALGSVMVAGTIGQLIPPSIYAVVFAGFAEIDVGRQLLAGLLPGLLLAGVYILLTTIYVLVWPRLIDRSAGPTLSANWSDRFSAVLKIWPLATLLVLVIGGIYLGLVTTTEAGALGAIGAVLIGAWRLRPQQLGRAVADALRDTVASVGSIMFLLVGAALLNRMLAISGTAGWFADMVGEAGLSRLQLIGVVLIIYLVLGMFMEPLSMMLLTVPILLPVAATAGIEPIWFGVFFILMAEVALLTPPVGILVFVVHRMAQSSDVRGDHTISLADVFIAAMWYIPGVLIVIGSIVLWPELVSLIPDLASSPASP
jgi:tripartite ATP-independent transporter DctM subunit